MILVFQHHPAEGPGYLATLLPEHGFALHMVKSFAGEALTVSLDEVAGLVFMGGPMSVHDHQEYPWLAGEMDLIRQAVEVGVPVLGHCLGGQLIAKALGGEVEANAVPEAGWFPVQRHLLPAEAEDLWGDLPETFTPLHLHGERFLPPSGSWRLYGNDACSDQAFAIGSRVLAFQCHPEATVQLVADWVKAGFFAQEPESATVQNVSVITGDADQYCRKLQGMMTKIYQPWLNEAQARKERLTG